jgi:hypothetical protein
MMFMPQKLLQQHPQHKTMCLDVLILIFNPRYISTTPVKSPARCFDEATGVIESKTVEKFFLDPTVPETSVGRMVCSYRFGSKNSSIECFI